MLILKQNAANTVPTPPAGKGTIFLDDSDTLSVKTSDGNVENFPTVAASNSQVVFMNGTSLSGDAELTYNFNTNVLTVTGNIAAGNVLTDNLLYANGTAWDLSDPGGSNTQIQFNDDESFGGSAAFTFNKSTNTVSIGNTLSVTGNASAGNVNAGNLLTANFVTGTLTTAAQPNITSVGTLTDLNVSGNTIIGGNLTVNGNVVYVNVETLDVEDPVIVLGGGPNGAAPVSDDGKDRGTQLQYYSGSAKNAFMGWDNSNSEFGMGSVVTVTNDVVTFTTYGNLRVGNIIGNGQALTGINGANVTGTVANATHASTANTVVDAAQPNITSVGTLSSLSVTGNTTSNNFNATTYVTASSIYANSGSVGAQYVAASVDVTANRDVLAGNVYANSGIIGGNTGNFSANVSAGGVKTDNLYYANGTPWDLSDPGGSNTQIQFNDDESFGGSAAFTFDKSSNLVSVSANLNANNLNATTHVTAGNVWANTGTVGGSLLTGTLTTASQPNVTSLGTLSSLSVTGNAGANNFNATTHVTAGNVYANSGTVGASLLTGTLTTASQPNVTSVGTLSSLSVTGNVSAGNVYSNSGTIGASLLTGTLTTASQPNVTSLGTLSGLGVNGNITAANFTANTGVFTGNAAGLTNIPGGNITGNITGNISNAAHAVTANTIVDAAQPNVTSVGTLTSLDVSGNLTSGNANLGNLAVANFVTGTLTTNAQPNVTSVGILTGLTVDGSNITLANGVYVGNGSGLTAIAGANVTGTVANATHASTANTVVDAAQPNITSVGTLTSLAVTGNASAGNVSATGDISGATLTGTLTTASQPNITSVGTLSSLTVTGNANVGNIGATNGVFTNVSGNGAALTALPGGNVTGQVANALVSGTVYTAAQPNITSVGTLTSLAVTGNASAGNISTGGVLSVTGNANVGNLGTAGLITATGNVSGGNLTTAGVVAATGNVSGGNLTTAGALSVTGNANTGNLGTTTLIATTGNITTINSGLLQNGNSNIAITANGNVSIQAAGSTVELVVTSTGANISGTLNTTGNANVGNLGTAGLIVATGNVTGGNLTTAGALSVTGNANVGNIGGGSGVFTGTVSATGNVSGGNLTTTGILSVTGTGTSSIAGNLDMTSNNITNLASPVNSTDAATKQYVDDVAQGLHTHDSCNAATDGTLATISGGTVTYNNGSSGVGATLTTTGSYTTIDGVTLQNGMRILVKNEANAAHNGIYDRTSSTVLTRSSDFDTSAEMAGGDFTFVNGGTLYDNTGWVMPDPVTTVGTTAVNWVQFSGAGTYTAGTGLTLTGTVFSVNASQTQITSVGTLGSLTVSGNASAGNISTGGALSVTGNANVGNIGATNGVFTSVSGNGSALTALNASNISTGTLAQARLANSTLTLGNTTLTLGGTTTTVAGLSSVTSTTFVGALTGAATTAGTVTTAAQPNITSVGTLSSLAVTGNGSFGNVSATTFTGSLSGAATTAGTVTTAAQPNITSVGTLSSLAVTGNISAGNVSATTFTGALSGAATTAGTVTTAAQPNITSVGTLTGLTLAANADITMSGTGSNINGVALVSATLFAGSGANLTTLNGSNITTGTIAAARIATLNQNTTGSAATVTTAAQPNITSVSSSFTSLTFANAQTITGNNITFSTGANTNAGTLTGNFTLSTGSRLQATYADLAEKYLADADYEEGTVLIFGGDQEVTISTEYDSHRVAGVVSHNAAYVMNAKLEGEHVIDLALTGRVPVKVHGPVVKGDLMVTGPNGHAVANNQARAGTILGKALQNFEGGSGIIEVVVGRV